MARSIPEPSLDHSSGSRYAKTRNWETPKRSSIRSNSSRSGSSAGNIRSKERSSDSRSEIGQATASISEAIANQSHRYRIIGLLASVETKWGGTARAILGQCVWIRSSLSHRANPSEPLWPLGSQVRRLRRLGISPARPPIAGRFLERHPGRVCA